MGDDAAVPSWLKKETDLRIPEGYGYFVLFTFFEFYFVS